MADSAISQLTLAGSGLQADEFAIGDVGSSEKITLSQIAKFTNVSGILKSLSANEAPSFSTSMIRVSGMDVTGVDAGTYIFEYYIRAQVATSTAQSIKFAVNHTGTTTAFPYFLQYKCAGVNNSTGAITQAANISTGRIYAHQATRIKNTTLGPETGIDIINSDILLRVSGMMIVTVTGTLELYFGAQTTVGSRNITIMAGTCLILKRVG